MSQEPTFLKYKRKEPPKRPVDERIGDYSTIEQMLPRQELIDQSKRCQDCGIPFCHTYGCPVENVIPDFNTMVRKDQWRKALELLHSHCCFPEFTGRVCPAPCETACTMAVGGDAVAIRHIELQIVERGWEEGWIVPEPAEQRSGFSIAVIGSGPAGLAAAQILARAGHEVVVFEKSDRIGGLLRYGIPDYKLEKWVIDRRLEQLEGEGVRFKPCVNVGVDISAKYLMHYFDGIVLTTGAGVPRDLTVPGRDLDGVHFAMPYLTQQNRINAGDTIPDRVRLTAEGKKVVVIGGGDTGSDCIGTSHRQGAARVEQLEIMPEPPPTRSISNPWPTWPNILRTSTSHEEGCVRHFSASTKEFLGDGEGRLRALKCIKVEWVAGENNGRMIPCEIPGSEFEIEADLALLAMGFVHTEHGPLIHALDIETDDRGNILVDDNYMTSQEGVFSAGDSMKGASLIVHAIALGRNCAEKINEYLLSKK